MDLFLLLLLALEQLGEPFSQLGQGEARHPLRRPQLLGTRYLPRPPHPYLPQQQRQLKQQTECVAEEVYRYVWQRSAGGPPLEPAAT
jgi:hypothetical protein